MTIDQAQTVAELLEYRDSIVAIQKKLKLDGTVAIAMTYGLVTLPEIATPYFKEALEKAKSEIEAKIAEI